ncbi:MAG TPA: endonuclease/exonuclease/phosphatase [Verrucomicrobiota bacterium]|nr:endonuclease/exonuclease/phosphatase [Verrucomicrobiota bacterium]
MQRLLSLATLGVLGGFVWMFLSGGALDQLGQTAGGGPPPPAGAWNSGTVPWPQAPPPSAPAVQPVGVGSAAPPADVGPTIKIAAFNIQVFGQKKASNPAVMATLRRIIRESHGVASQKIRTQDDYFIPNFVSSVNRPAGDVERRYDYVVGPRLGNSTQTEQYAFLWDTDRVMCSRSSVYTVGDPENLLHREPLVATFATRINPDEAFTFTLINVHTDPSSTALRGELDALAEVYRVVRRAGGNEDDVIMLGDFNASDANLGRLGQIPGMTPLIRGVFTNTRQNKLYDNILIHGPSTTEYTGRSGVLDLLREYNLTLAQAELVSDHFPVWAEFSAYERDQTGRIASRRNAAR